MKLNNIEHVFFDLDHTLWDFDKNSELAFREIFINKNIDLDVEDFLEVYKPINFKYWELYRNDSVTKEALRYGRLKESFDSLKFEAVDATIYSIADDYIACLPKNNYLLDGGMEVLNTLQEKYRLHIITNGFQEVQQKKMQASGIHDFFETITTSEEAGVKKPHPQIFELALKKSNAEASRSVMIGDNLEADIIGAHSFGLKVFHLNPQGQGGEYEYPQIQKLKELLNYL